MGQGWMCGAGTDVWGRDGCVGQGRIRAGTAAAGRDGDGAGIDVWGRDGCVGQEFIRAGMDAAGRDGCMGQGWIYGAGTDVWGRDGDVGQGSMCGAGTDVWGRDGSVQGRPQRVGLQRDGRPARRCAAHRVSIRGRSAPKRSEGTVSDRFGFRIGMETKRRGRRGEPKPFEGCGAAESGER